MYLGVLMSNQKLVKEIASKNCMVDKEAASMIDQKVVSKISKMDETPLVINKAFIKRLKEDEKEFQDDRRNLDIKTNVEVIRSFERKDEEEEKEIEDFVEYYNDRFERLKNILMKRRELKSAVSLSRLEDIDKEEVCVVGMVIDKYKTRKGKYIVYLEDPTGETKVLVSEDEGDKIMNDEVIGVKGNTGDDIIFANKVIMPDVPIPSNLRQTEEEVYAAFMSDLHIGSKDTMNNKLDKFLEWLRSDEEMVKNLKYLFFVGDLVEGIGIYNGQKDDLEYTNIEKQYERFQEFVKRIPKDMEVIISPGNHDIVRMAEPQPPLPERVVPELYQMPNVHMVPNPAWIRIHRNEDNKGIEVLLYHGYSFDNHVDAQPDLRKKAYTNPECAMIDLLKRRHLAPTYTTNLISPEERDYLVVEKVPDIFAMGHIHNFTASNYKGVNLICASTFQAQTDFQKRIGHKPDPGKVAMINLKTRKTLIKIF